MWLHNKCQDYNITWLQRLIGFTGIAPSASAVQKEPTHVSRKYPGIWPLDIGITTISGLKGLDITITRTAPVASNPAEHEKTCLHVHTCKELLKWRGSSRPNTITAEHKTKGTKVSGHLVIEDLLSNGVRLLPA
eukprot:2509648-Ditylum_brightwellii.AAC.1